VETNLNDKNGTHPKLQFNFPQYFTQPLSVSGGYFQRHGLKLTQMALKGEIDFFEKKILHQIGE